MSLPPPDETRALAEKVKELRQALEDVEARIRELSIPPGERALEPLDVPTVLTTNHAQREVRRDRLALVAAACAAGGLVAIGIAIGALFRTAAPAASTDAPTTSAVTTAAPPPPAAPTAPAEPPPAAATPASPPAATAALAPAPAVSSAAAVVAAPAAADDRTARRKNDYGF